MQLHKQVFNNLFSDKRITATRFRNFCRFALNALTQANTDGKYDDAIARIQTVLDSLNAELNDVDTGLTQQVNSTTEMMQLIEAFGRYMQTAAGAIAFNLGGKDTPAYRTFYPYKPKEYYKWATKGNMPDFTARVATAAKAYADQLGDKLASDLEGFAPAFQKLVNSQETQMTAVNQDRKSRNTAFANGQLTLTGVVHDVASLNVGNPQEVDKFFPFNMLVPQTKVRVHTIKGDLVAGETRELLNRILTNSVTVTVQNTCVNADVLLWLAASPKDEMATTPITIKANSTATVKAGDLGDLKNPFLMIANNSNINGASFTVNIKGLKKTPVVKEKKTAGKDDSMKVAS